MRHTNTKNRPNYYGELKRKIHYPPIEIVRGYSERWKVCLIGDVCGRSCELMLEVFGRGSFPSW